MRIASFVFCVFRGDQNKCNKRNGFTKNGRNTAINRYCLLSNNHANLLALLFDFKKVILLNFLVLRNMVQFLMQTLGVFPCFAQAAFSLIGVILCVFCNGKALVVVLRH